MKDGIGEWASLGGDASAFAGVGSRDADAIPVTVGDQTYAVSLSDGGRRVQVTTGEPPRTVTGEERRNVLAAMKAELAEAEGAIAGQVAQGVPATKAIVATDPDRPAAPGSPGAPAGTPGFSSDSAASLMAISEGTHDPVDGCIRFEFPNQQVT